jgi:S-adenosylmethionine:tRNA ribosyltransferase-isomerase
MNFPEIDLSVYTYHLPDARIARYPVEPRDSSKLLVYQYNTLTNSRFSSLTDFLSTDSFLVFNDTKVIPARLFFQKPTGATIEVFLLEPEQPSRLVVEAMTQTQSCVWKCMIGNKKRWKIGEQLSFDSGRLQIGSTEFGIVKSEQQKKSLEVTATLIDYEKNLVKFEWTDGQPFVEIVQTVGQIPLPPYLKRQTESQDLATYQTVYSKNEGAVAAPTAGLHFTDNVFKNLAQKGIAHDFVTLHVGAGTFQPIKVKAIAEHDMHCEQVMYSRSFIENIIKNIQNIVVVGTTSMRAVESLYWLGLNCLKQQKAGENVRWHIEKNFAYQQDNLPTASRALEVILNYMTSQNMTQIIAETQILIVPGYRFQICKGLITNYHQPDSTLILLVAAFVGDAAWRHIYEEALTGGYRFLSYGDSSLLLPAGW